mmetsp:Transcript_99248/g.276345  ORF Transcript_99248/g.276345 Transcript_99248/m.276345 type:complete len:202 (-) Transcript_99248:5-610(-)
MLWHQGPECTPEFVRYIPAIISSVCAVGHAGYFFRKWRRPPTKDEDSELYPSITMWYTVDGIFLLMGVFWFFTGLSVWVCPPLCLELEAARIDAYRTTFCGVGWLVPTLTAFALGRGRLFVSLAPQFEWVFEHSRAVQDGAFIAALLDSVAIQKGGEWWVHHGRDDKRYTKHDPRRNWQPGNIVEITEDLQKNTREEDFIV